MLRFLDNRLAPAEPETARLDPGAPMPFLTRDYEREINDALDANESLRAKRALRDLKRRFDEAPDGTAEKNQLKTLLVALYERFRIRVERDDDQNPADTDLARLMRSWGIQPIEPTVPRPSQELLIDEERPRSRADTTARSVQASPDDAPPLAGTAQQDPIAPEEPDAPARAVLIAHANELLATVERRLNVGDLRGAVRVYRETRRDVLAVEGGVPDDLAQRFLDSFTRLRKEILTRTSKGAQPAPDLPMALVRSPAGEHHPVQPALLPPLPPLPSSKRESAPTRAAGLAAVVGIATPDIPPAPIAAADTDAAAAFDRSVIAQLDTRKRELDDAAQRHDFAAAMRAYDAMRTAALYLHDPELQAGAARKLRIIHGLLTRLRHAAGDGERHLARTVP